MHRRSLNKFLLSAAAFAVAGSLARGSADASTGRYAVHEWGTFTTFQGAKGGLLEGLHHEEEPLPSFVHSVTGGQSGTLVPAAAATSPRRPIEVRVIGENPAHTRPNAAPRTTAMPVSTATPASTPTPIPTPTPKPPRCYKGLPCDRVISRVTTKMETPVIYFHTDRARRVRVHVDFENGLLSQFYPAAKLEGFRSGDDIDLSRIKRTSLEWQLDLVPHGDAKMPVVPAVAADDPWQFAREVRCASLVTTDTGEAERYLFYRGLGRLDLPIGVVAEGKGRVIAKNDGLDAVPAAFLLEMGPQGGRFLELGALPGGSARAASFGDAPLASREAVVASLKDRVQAALVAEGLYEDEAIAMVRTWSRTWFGSEGTRLLYVVPRPVTDAVLPLSIDPKPPELVRVLVGRVEFLTPEAEREAEAAFRDQLGGEPKAAEAAGKRLGRFGRFLEPVARRVLETSRDSQARAGAQLVVDGSTPSVW